MNVDKSSIFKVANAIRRSQNGLTIGEALRMAWKAAKLQVKLAAGEVRFRYRKVNGEIREAVGTLKNMLMEATSYLSGLAMLAERKESVKIPASKAEKKKAVEPIQLSLF